MAVRQNRLGHTEAQTTMAYTDAVTADERRIADELGRILHVNARNEQQHQWQMRPRDNARRFQRSAARLAMPVVPEDLFLEALRELVRLGQIDASS